jgi:hypothetical protein
MVSSAYQAAMLSYMAVSPHKADQADHILSAIAVGVQRGFLIFDRSPQSFDEDVVLAAPP